MGNGANGDRSTRGGKSSGAGTIWGNSGFGMMVDSPVPPEGPGLDVNIGDGDLLLITLLQPLRSA